MMITVFPTWRQAAVEVAARIAAALGSRPDLVLGLPTGRTPVLLYRELASLAARGDADFSRATTFNLDEFLGVGPDDRGSYRAFMERHLFSKIPIPRDRINFLNGATDDPDAECARYERAIAAAGGIDLQLLGIGANGHIGFNEPADALVSLTHRVTLRQETRRANAGLFGGDVNRVPAEALSMGMATILQARGLVLLATGAEKARCIERMVNGQLTTRLPASFLQLHPQVNVVLDASAGRYVT
jgi:glucosamine-6-phosphate deaminase